MARRGTKAEVVEQFDALLDRAFTLTDRLYELHDEGKITYDCLLTYAWYAEPSFKAVKKLRSSRSAYAKTKLWDFRFYLRRFEEFVNELEQFVTEQEATTMETCQKAQVQARIKARKEAALSLD